MIFSAIKEIYDEDPSFIFDKISHKLRHTVTEFDESGKSEPTGLFTWYGKDKKGDSLAIVIKNKNGNDYLSLGYYDQDGYHIQKGFRIDGDNLTQYCSKKPGVLLRGLNTVKQSLQNHLQQVPIIKL